MYQPGELKVVAYKNGKEWATDTVKTAGAPAKLVLSPDRSNDSRRRPRSLLRHRARRWTMPAPTLPRANNHIKFTIEGPGEIVATDNGDPTSFEPFPAAERNAFNGRALVIVRTLAGRPGTIRDFGAIRRSAGRIRHAASLAAISQQR